MKARQAGFSLVELIVVIMISSLVVGLVASFLTVPAQAHFAQARRSELSASATTVTHWLARDVRRALPDSLRTGMVGGRAVVEMVRFGGVERYRDEGTEGDPLEIYSGSPPDDRFDVLGSPSVITTAVVVNNRGLPGQDVYEMANVIAAATMALGSPTITLSDSAFRFSEDSPRRRLFLVSPATAVIRYECDAAAGTLRRYDNLPIQNPLGALPGGTPSRLISTDIAACTFARRPSTDHHGGLLLVNVTISRVTNGSAETLRIAQQLKVEEVR